MKTAYYPLVLIFSIVLSNTNLNGQTTSNSRVENKRSDYENRHYNIYGTPDWQLKVKGSYLNQATNFKLSQWESLKGFPNMTTANIYLGESFNQNLPTKVTPVSAEEISLKMLDRKDFQSYVDWIFDNFIYKVLHSGIYSNLYNYKPENYINEKHIVSSRLFFDGQENINFEFIFGNENRVIAQAHSPFTGDVRIIINIDKWEELNNYERIWLLAHEWGHEAFDLKHGESSLMYPLMPSDELKDLSYTRFGYDSSKVTVAYDTLINGLREMIGFILDENEVKSRYTILDSEILNEEITKFYDHPLFMRSILIHHDTYSTWNE